MERRPGFRMEMRAVFISYQRDDAEAVVQLAEDINALGYKAWYDQELTGGQKWWDQILKSARDCDVFLFALSARSLESLPCKEEYRYAGSLGKIILPVLISGEVDVDLLPPELSQIQFVDYREGSRDQMRQLSRALNQLPQPTPPIPEPLPPEPPVPVSQFGKIKARLDSKEVFSYEAQTALLLDIKQLVRESKNKESGLSLLKILRKRPDIFARVADEIDNFLNEFETRKREKPRKDKTITPSAPASEPIDQKTVLFKNINVIGLLFFSLGISRLLEAAVHEPMNLIPLAYGSNPFSVFGIGAISALCFGVYYLVLKRLTRIWSRALLNFLFLIFIPLSTYCISRWGSGFMVEYNTVASLTFVFNTWVLLATRDRLSKLLTLLVSGVPSIPLFLLLFPSGYEAAGIFIGSYVNILAVWFAVAAINRNMKEAQ